MTNIEYIEGDKNLLALIEPLWEKLNRHHQARSVHFADVFANLTFAERLASFQTEDESMIRVVLAKDLDSEVLVGYCISTVDQYRVGEIESIYVEHVYRRLGIGDFLIRNALDWVKAQSARLIQLSVTFGNEEVFPFYERYGFLPRRTILVIESKE